MRSKTILVVTVLLLVGLMSVGLIAGCGSGTGGTTTSVAPATSGTTAPSGGPATTAAGTPTTGSETTAGQVQFDGTITIGALDSLTGPMAMAGAEQVWTRDLAVKDINAAGGINLNGKHMKLEIKHVDDKGDSVEAAAGVEKLVKADNINIILSAQNTPMNQAAAIVAEKYHAVYMQSFTWTPTAREAKYQWSPDLFFSPAVVGEMPFLVADKMSPADQPKNWGILTSDESAGQSLAEGFKEVAKKHPYANVVAAQTYTAGAKDYSSAIVKFKQSNVDGLVALISAADGITFVKQMKEQGLSPKFFLGWMGFWPTEFMQGLGTDSQYILHDADWCETQPYPYAKELGAAYTADHDGQSSVAIGLFYAQVQILKMAIEQAGSTDPAAVRDQIYGGTFKGTTMGDITFDAGGVADFPPLILQWMDGKRVLITGNESALKLMVPWDKR